MNAMPIKINNGMLVPNEVGGYTQTPPEMGTPLHTFDITPELKQQVQTQGLPQYKKGGDIKLTHNHDSMWMEVQDKKFKGK